MPVSNFRLDMVKAPAKFAGVFFAPLRPIVFAYFLSVLLHLFLLAEWQRSESSPAAVISVRARLGSAALPNRGVGSQTKCQLSCANNEAASTGRNQESTSSHNVPPSGEGVGGQHPKKRDVAQLADADSIPAEHEVSDDLIRRRLLLAEFLIANSAEFIRPTEDLGRMRVRLRLPGSTGERASELLVIAPKDRDSDNAMLIQWVGTAFRAAVMAGVGDKLIALEAEFEIGDAHVNPFAESLPSRVN